MPAIGTGILERGVSARLYFCQMNSAGAKFGCWIRKKGLDILFCLILFHVSLDEFHFVPLSGRYLQYHTSSRRGGTRKGKVYFGLKPMQKTGDTKERNAGKPSRNLNLKGNF